MPVQTGEGLAVFMRLSLQSDKDLCVSADVNYRRGIMKMVVEQLCPLRMTL